MSTSDALARAAFFDVDKTLLPGSSLYLLARGMYKRGMYTGRDLVGFAVGQVAFRVRGVESLKGIDAAREAALAFIEGKRQHELEPLAQDIVVEVIGPRIYPGMRKVIDAHHANGDRTYLVTAAPVDIAKRISAYLGMDGALGTRVECVDGVYTGKLLGPVLHGRAKLEAVRALAARGTALVLATHDPAVVRLSERTFYLRHGAMEAEATGQDALSVIDDAGRVQLPPEALKLFPARRARIGVEQGRVWIGPP